MPSSYLSRPAEHLGFILLLSRTPEGLHRSTASRMIDALDLTHKGEQLIDAVDRLYAVYLMRESGSKDRPILAVDMPDEMNDRAMDGDYEIADKGKTDGDVFLTYEQTNAFACRDIAYGAYGLSCSKEADQVLTDIENGTKQAN